MTSTALNHSAAGFCLAVEGDTVALYYLRDKDRGYYRCDTAISGAALESKLADWPSNGASYLFETDYGYNLVDSCFVVLQGQAQLHSVTAQNPVGGSYDPSGLAALFGINSYMERNIPRDALRVAMCVEGRQQTSEEFARLLSDRALSGRPSLCFLIGSSFGLDEEFKNSADMRLSLSAMTFPHHLARVMLAEQIYRGFKIGEGSRYHK